MFCEGTRFTKEKHEESMKVARQKGLLELKHHLLPRTKGFSLLARGAQCRSKNLELLVFSFLKNKKLKFFWKTN